MTILTRADVWLLLALAWSVVLGYGLWEWLAIRRKTARDERQIALAEARRLAAELAFWQALMRVVDGAETPARAVGEIRSVRAMREQIADNECRRLREDIDSWGA